MKITLLSWDKLLVGLGVVSVITTASAAGAVMYQKANPAAEPEPIQELQASTTTTANGQSASTAAETDGSGAEQGTPASDNASATAVTATGGGTPVAMVQFPGAPAIPRLANTPSAVNTGGTVFDAASLALHDGRDGTCYIAYNGQVYDVSSHPSWVNCTHHGIQGGRDITSVFPHPVSRLNGLPVVGTYSNGTTVDPNPGTSPVTGDDDEQGDDSDENEIEDRDTEDSHDSEDQNEVEDQQIVEDSHDSNPEQDRSETEQEKGDTGLVIQAGSARSTLVA